MYDFRLNEIFQKLNTPTLTKIMNGITFFASFYMFLIMGLIIFFLKGKKMFWHYLISLFFTYMFVFLTKQAFQITRPYLYTDKVLKLSTEELNPLSYSFISGHSMIASFIPTYLLITYKKKSFAFLYIFTPVIMFSRIYLGMHYLSDTIAGASIGVVATIYYKPVVNKFKYKKEYMLIPFLLGVIYLIFQSQRSYHAHTIFTISLISFALLMAYLVKYPDEVKFSYNKLSYIILITYAIITISRFIYQIDLKINNDNFIYLVLIALGINIYAMYLIPSIYHLMEVKHEKIKC